MTEPVREYYDNGQLYCEIYIVNGKRHREDGPAYNRWYETGQREYEVYYVNGVHHREDGPAITWWDEDGNITSQEFWLDGEQVTAYDVLGDTPEAFTWVMSHE